MFKRIDHVVIAVKDLEAAATLYGEHLGLKGSEPADVPAIGVRRINFDVGDAFIELAQPVADSSPVAKFVAERGEGLYLIAVQVHDRKAAVKVLREKGARIIGDESTDGQVFIHPKSTHGVLMQLVE